ncbi:MAG TPA: glycosyltransferase family 2 protein [Aggregatilineales bacterium]|nr:glycosyltransferase family 2 protein [Anaerolineales bacterium]HRE47409.1 glycosyltransferase family 2 protein [Aggregatilineales bacterium]
MFTNPPLDLAIVLVTWNVRELALDAIRTVRADLAESGLGGAIWVVDNASADGTAEAIQHTFPDVHLIASERNLGFAAGNNLALRALGFADTPTPAPQAPRAVFLLNPDTRTEQGALQALYEALFTLPRAGIVGARLAYEDGAFQHSAFRFPGLAQLFIDLYPLPNRLRARLYETPLNGRYPRRRYETGSPFAVDHTLGATMLFRREAIEATGLFDEGYFMYVEEVDWSMRVQRAGWAIYTVPSARITHLEGRSTRQVRAQSIVNLWRSRLKFYDRYYPRWKRAAARLLVRGGMRLKIRAVRREGSLPPEVREALIAAYREVIAL